MVILKNGGKRKELKKATGLFSRVRVTGSSISCVCVCVCARARVNRACVQMSQSLFIIYLSMEKEPTDPCALAGDRHLTAMLQYRGAVSHATLSVARGFDAPDAYAPCVTREPRLGRYFPTDT